MKTTSKTNLIYESTVEKDTSSTISAYLKESSTLSGRSLRQYFFKGLVLINHKKAHSQAKLKLGDLIQVYAPGTEYQALKPEPMDLDVIYENNDLLVINKPPLIAVHPSGSITSGTLANGITAYFEKKDLKIKVRPVNRLDYGTSGLIIFAKSAAVQERLSLAIQKHTVQRIYYAVVQGVPEPNSGTINLPITGKNGKRIVALGGQSSITEYKVIKAFNNAALLELNLKTGRTHQIRVHLSHIGHPILGDHQYGTKTPLINRPALHAGKLIFQKGLELDLSELAIPLPADMKNLLHNFSSLH